jgi:hypothetical protein
MSRKMREFFENSCLRFVTTYLDIAQISHKYTSVFGPKQHFLKNILFIEDSMYVAFEHTLVAPFFFPHIDWHIVTRMPQNQKML